MFLDCFFASYAPLLWTNDDHNLIHQFTIANFFKSTVWWTYSLIFDFIICSTTWSATLKITSVISRSRAGNYSEMSTQKLSKLKRDNSLKEANWPISSRMTKWFRYLGIKVSKGSSLFSTKPLIKSSRDTTSSLEIEQAQERQSPSLSLSSKDSVTSKHSKMVENWSSWS